MRLAHATALSLLLAAASLLGAAEPPIRIPTSPVVPSPMPAPAPQPAPGDVVRLTADLLYVIDSDVDLLILSSPAGVVNVVEEEGPVKVRGRFVDAPGKVETRTFKGKSVHTVEVLKSGRVELLIIPVGAKAPVLPNDIIRRTLDVEAGEGPIPPPKPDPKPDPDPVKKVARVTVVVCEDLETRTPAQARAINDPEFRKFAVELVSVKDPAFAANGYKRFADKVGLPAVLVFDADAAGPSDPVAVFKLGDAADNVAQVRKVVK